MRIVFLGSGAFAVPALEALAKAHEVVGVFTQPDRPAGRGLRLTPPPVKPTAQGLGLTVHQPERIKDPQALKQIESLNPQAIVVVAYGQILPAALLELPPLGAINLHASLLPKYRGAAPVHWALIRGETHTGVTAFLMDEGMDTGPILLQEAVEIDDEETAGSLAERLARLGAPLLLEALEGLEAGTLEPVPQDESQATLAPKLKKSDGLLRWERPARELFHRVRGTSPFPGAFTFYSSGDERRRLKVHRARPVDEASRGEPGLLLGVTGEGLLVQAEPGVLELLEVQPDSRPRMSGADFARGYRLARGARLG